ncbi:hypothetical protein N7528_008140 [Penicillium herquei]|nr:hypothetical protein N7528_008140 [Penicillium herquei]
MVAEDSSSFERDERVLQLFLSAYGGIDSEGLGFAGHLKNSLILYEPDPYFIPDQLLIIAISIEELKRCLNIRSRLPYVSETNNFPSQALDLSVFTLETHCNTVGAYENSPPIISVLSDLYQLVMAFGERYHHDLTTVFESDQHSTPWMVPFQEPITDSINEAYPQNDARIPALLHASQILTWRGISTQVLSLNLCHALHLKALLLNTDLDGFWDSLPGALIWCLVIGVRCSPPGPLRQWFMMQTTRVTCTMTINCSQAVLKSLRVLLAGMDGAGG